MVAFQIATSSCLTGLIKIIVLTNLEREKDDRQACEPLSLNDGKNIN